MRAALATLLLVLVSACATRSIHPIYTDADLIFDSAAIGSWRTNDSSSVATFKQTGPTEYSLVLSEDDEVLEHFSAHVIRSGGVTLLDVFPVDLPDSLGENYGAHFIPAHTFFTLRISGTRLVLGQFEPDSISALLRRQPAALAHIRIDDDVILTAEPRALQTFFATYMRRPGVLDTSSVWTRVPAKH